MKRRLLSLLIVGFTIMAVAGLPAEGQDRLRLTGSGASFPFPIYSAWFKAFSSKHKTRHRRLPGQGQRRRRPGLHQPDGGFRR